MSTLDELRRRHAAAEEGGGAERRERQHREGKLSARERIDLLVDEGSFEETGRLVRHRCRDFGMEAQTIDGDGFVTGYGQVLVEQLGAGLAAAVKTPVFFLEIGSHGYFDLAGSLFAGGECI